MREFWKNKFILTCDTDKDRFDYMYGIKSGHSYSLFDVYCFRKIKDDEYEIIDDEDLYEFDD